MNRKVLILIAIITVAAISSAAAYSNYYAIEQANVDIRDSNVHIENSNVTLGENVTITNPPGDQSPTEPAKPAENETEPTPETGEPQLIVTVAHFGIYKETAIIKRLGFSGEIQNVGTATAYNVSVNIKTWFSNGTLAFDKDVIIYTNRGSMSMMWFQGPLNIKSGETWNTRPEWVSTRVPEWFNEDAINTYKITPLWVTPE